ncbi:hypothetical protein SCCGRSA3_02005 [Marine Group I thaumarchaeote SCGC RSA3]|uniref:Uncharacterized protein n=2 Tax=Marine Group I TaxID=905826 RepID=A0A081RNW1_9ARCH|nr:hypothetical protein AAA799N04_00554 [Marine Group I thaumarchaeote SCGC AAA799-N04]KFM16970.1 hypothetical protein SCCGRSA3_02005 [Marine Group I thaumarchaeote SCGC RSA3]
MKIRYIAIGATAAFVLGIVITLISFESIPSEPPENLPEGMTPIMPEVGKTSTPAGPYLIFASIIVLIGAGIYSMISLANRRRK